MLLLRLSPLFPYSVLNYALSLTSVPLGSYIAASWAGMLPATVAYVALGGAGKAAAERKRRWHIHCAARCLHSWCSWYSWCNCFDFKNRFTDFKNYESEEEDE